MHLRMMRIINENQDTNRIESKEDEALLSWITSSCPLKVKHCR